MIIFHILLFTLANLIGQNHATYNRTLSQLAYRLSGQSINFASDGSKMIFKESGRYIPRNIVSTRMQFNQHRLFVTQPRYKSGVPITLASVNLQTKACRLTMEPYPSWTLQQEGNCESIQSAIDLYLDRNQVLWVLDAGATKILETTPNKNCTPKVISISTITNRIMKTIDLKPFVTNSSDVQFMVIENSSNGDDYVYISDAGGKAIIVFDVNAGRGRRLVLPPNLTDGANSSTNAIYLALIRKQNNNYLYLVPCDCNTIYSIPTSSLGMDESQSSIQLEGKSSAPIVILGTDGQSKLYFRLKQQSDVFVWDTNTPFPSGGGQMVRRGEDKRLGTHVTMGLFNLPWILETNINDFVSNSTGCLGASTKLSPITGFFD